MKRPKQLMLSYFEKMVLCFEREMSAPDRARRWRLLRRSPSCLARDGELETVSRAGNVEIGKLRRESNTPLLGDARHAGLIKMQALIWEIAALQREYATGFPPRSAIGRVDDGVCYCRKCRAWHENPASRCERAISPSELMCADGFIHGYG